MDAEALKLYRYDGKNPFADSQGRNFSDVKIQKEFFATSKFWTLFNENHEILIGARGSGKTFLLKMMRRSMLKNVNSEMAKEVVDKKLFYSLYIPMFMESITALLDKDIPEDRSIMLFKFVFNSILAESLLEELKSCLDEIQDQAMRLEKNNELANKIGMIWYQNRSHDFFDLDDLATELRTVIYNFDYVNDEINKIPTIFKREIAAPLIAVKANIMSILSIPSEATWILCVDEAEFIPERFQKCLNSFMRSSTNGIALKIGTLPFYWKTLDTLDGENKISQENDFNYQILDMTSEETDFVALTNTLCHHRLMQLSDIEINVDSLEEFVGQVGNDKLIDYYRNIVGEKKH